MRCLSCNNNLTDFEATRKSAFSGQYIDLCNHCFASVNDDMATLDRPDLAHDQEDENFNEMGTDLGIDFKEDL